MIYQNKYSIYALFLIGFTLLSPIVSCKNLATEGSGAAHVPSDSVEFEYAVDESIQYTPSSAESYDGRTAPIDAAVFGSFPPKRFVANEVIIMEDDSVQVAEFARTYDGKILFREDDAQGGSERMNVVRVNPAKADLASFEENAMELMRRDSVSSRTLRISSEQGARLLAIIASARLDGISIYPDVLARDGSPPSIPTSYDETSGRSADTGTVKCSRSDFNLPNTSNAQNWEYLNWESEPKIGVPEAWSLLKYHGREVPESERARIGIIDTKFCLPDGVSAGRLHEDAQTEFPIDYAKFDPIVFTKQFTHGSQYVNPVTNIEGLDLCDYARSNTSNYPYHGTKVASVAFAEANNKYGVAGTSGSFRIGTKEYQFTGKPYLVEMRETRASGLHLSLDKTVDEKVDIVNMSWNYPAGGGGFLGFGPKSTREVVEPAIHYMHRNKVLPITGAGNGEGDNDCPGDKVKSLFPCILSETICVGGINPSATNTQGQPVRHRQSNYGKNIVDISAPYYTMYGWSPANPQQNQKRFFPGTSAASPFVAGIASMLWSIHPNPSPDAIRQLIYDTARPAAYGDEMRHGYVCALCAVEELLEDRSPEVEFTEGKQHNDKCYVSGPMDLTFEARGRDVRDFLHDEPPSLQWEVNEDLFQIDNLNPSNRSRSNQNEWRIESFTRTFSPYASLDPNQDVDPKKTVVASMRDSKRQETSKSVDFEIYHGKLAMEIFPYSPDIYLAVDDPSEWPVQLRASGNRKTCQYPEGRTPQEENYLWESGGTTLGTSSTLELDKSFFRSGNSYEPREVTLSWTGPDASLSDDVDLIPCTRSRGMNVEGEEGALRMCRTAAADFREQMRDVFREIALRDRADPVIERVEADFGDMDGPELMRRALSFTDNSDVSQVYLREIVDLVQSGPSMLEKEAADVLGRARADDQLTERDLTFLHRTVDVMSITEEWFSASPEGSAWNSIVRGLEKPSSAPSEVKSRLMAGALQGYLAGLVQASGEIGSEVSKKTAAAMLTVHARRVAREYGGTGGE